MAGGALHGVQRLAADRVRGQRAVDRPLTGGGHLCTLWHRTAQPRHVIEHRAHLRRVLRQRLAVHRTLQAAVDALGQPDHLARARHVARIGAAAGIEVVIAERPLALGHVARVAVQIVADIVRQQPCGLVEDTAAEHHRFGIAEPGDFFGAGRMVVADHLALRIEDIDRAGHGGIQVREQMTVSEGAGPGQHHEGDRTADQQAEAFARTFHRAASCGT